MGPKKRSVDGANFQFFVLVCWTQGEYWPEAWMKKLLGFFPGFHTSFQMHLTVSEEVKRSIPRKKSGIMAKSQFDVLENYFTAYFKCFYFSLRE